MADAEEDARRRVTTCAALDSRSMKTGRNADFDVSQLGSLATQRV